MKKIVSIIVLLSALVLFPRCTDKNTIGSVSSELTIKQILPKNIVTGATVAITGTNLQDVTEVIFPGGVPATSFKLVGFNQISAVAPAGITDGFITLKTKDKEVKATMGIKAVTALYTTLFPDTAKVGEVISIEGNNLLEIQQVIFPGNAIVNALYFTRKSDTEIQVAIPQGAALGNGLLKMVTLSGSSVDLGTVFIKSAAYVPVPLSYVFYEDALMNGWSNWGWGSTVDLANTENFRAGNKAIKATFTGSWGAIKFANSSVATSTYTELAFSVYGGPGTDGKKFNVQPTGGSTYSAVIKEGAWTEFNIPLSAFGNVDPIKELMLQETGWSGFVYLDHVGLR